MKKNIYDGIHENLILHIDKTIYKYLLFLMKYIFMGEKNLMNKEKIPEEINKLKEFTEHINKNIIKKEHKYILIEPKQVIYTFKNLLNIINFIKMQNLMYAGDILEGILIIIFSYSIEVSRDNDFGKFLYSNMSKIRESSNDILPQWFSKSENVFQHDEIKNIKTLLAKDFYFRDNLENYKDMTIFHKVLFEIMKLKKNYIKLSIEKTNNTKYISKNNYPISIMDLGLKNFIMNRQLLDFASNADKDFISNSFPFLYFYIFKEQKPPIKMLTSFLISVYIYYQNMKSPLINYCNQEKNDNKKENNNKSDNISDENIVDVPFTYQLKGANIEGRYANVILAPIAIEPRIIHINLFQNLIREPGLYELGKILSFNKTLKSINLNLSLIKGYYLEFFIYGFGAFVNNTLENLNLINDSLEESAEFPLADLLCHLKGLKTLNISGNPIKGGTRDLFIVLKKLYKKGETKLENLYLNRCFLTDSSFYELGELLKSQFCGLKRLSIGVNNKSGTINFLKNLKLNRSLEELIMYKSKIDNNDIDDICRIISNTNLKCLNLHRNKFNNFGKYLRIIFRTKIIKRKNKPFIKSNVVLNDSFMHLDLSNHEFHSINFQHIRMLNNLIQDNSTLNCFDMSHIVCGKYPDKDLKTMRDRYVTEVEEVVKTLANRKIFFTDLVKKKMNNEIDKRRNKKVKEEFEEEIKKLFIYENKDGEKYFFKYIEDNILNDEQAIFPAFLRDKCIDMINEEILAKKDIYKKLIETEKIVEQKNDDRYDVEKNANFIKKVIAYINYERAKRENIDFNKDLEWKNLTLI